MLAIALTYCRSPTASTLAGGIARLFGPGGYVHDSDPRDLHEAIGIIPVGYSHNVS